MDQAQIEEFLTRYKKILDTDDKIRLYKTKIAQCSCFDKNGSHQKSILYYRDLLDKQRNLLLKLLQGQTMQEVKKTRVKISKITQRIAAANIRKQKAEQDLKELIVSAPTAPLPKPADYYRRKLTEKLLIKK